MTSEECDNLDKFLSRTKPDFNLNKLKQWKDTKEAMLFFCYIHCEDFDVYMFNILCRRS